jgi:NSS family neurotransmitter:Na+ symporter
MPTESMGVRESWGSYLGFLLTTIGSAVGIGSIWRFPYMASMNGGGTFLFVYIIVIFTFGLAFMVLELAVGMHYKTSIVSTLARIRHRFKYLGLFMISVVVIILSYYMVVLGWILSYLSMSITGSYMDFNTFIDTWYPLLAFSAVVAINYTVVRSGIRKGVERFNKYAMLTLFALLIPLTLIGLSMDDGKAVDFYLKPDNDRILEPNVWAAALGQAFFSLSIGMGVLVTYGSYLQDSKRHSLLSTSLVIILSVLTVAFLSGLMVFSMVLANNLPLDKIQGAALVFIAIPKIIQSLEYSYIIGMMFFLLLFLAGITSSISMLQVPVSALEDAFNVSKGKAVLIITVIASILGIPSALSYSPIRLSISEVPFLDAFDWVFGTIALAVSATLMAIVFSWFIDKYKIMEQVNMNSRIRIPFIMLYIVRVFLPIMIIATLVKILLG